MHSSWPRTTVSCGAQTTPSITRARVFILKTCGNHFTFLRNRHMSSNLMLLKSTDPEKPLLSMTFSTRIEVRFTHEMHSKKIYLDDSILTQLSYDSTMMGLLRSSLGKQDLLTLEDIAVRFIPRHPMTVTALEMKYRNNAEQVKTQYDYGRLGDATQLVKKASDSDRYLFIEFANPFRLSEESHPLDKIVCLVDQ